MGYDFLWDDTCYDSLLKRFKLRHTFMVGLISSVTLDQGSEALPPSVAGSVAPLLPQLHAIGCSGHALLDQLAVAGVLRDPPDSIALQLEQSEETHRLQALMAVNSIILGEAKRATQRRQTDNYGPKPIRPRKERRSVFYCPVSGALAKSISMEESKPQDERNPSVRLNCGHSVSQKAMQSMTQITRHRPSAQSRNTFNCPYCSVACSVDDALALRY